MKRISKAEDCGRDRCPGHPAGVRRDDVRRDDPNGRRDHRDRRRQNSVRRDRCHDHCHRGRSATVATAAIVALRVALRGIVVRSKILRRRSVGFGLALVLFAGLFVAGIGMRARASGLSVPDVVVRILCVGVVAGFDVLLLVLVVSGFGEIERGAFAVGVRRFVAGGVRAAQ